MSATTAPQGMKQVEQATEWSVTVPLDKVGRTEKVITVDTVDEARKVIDELQAMLPGVPTLLSRAVTTYFLPDELVGEYKQFCADQDEQERGR